MDPLPLEPVEQCFELGPRQPHDPVADRRPGKPPLLEPLINQDQAGTVEDQALDPVAALGAEHHDHPRMRIEAELALRQGRQAVVAAPEVDRPGGDHHPYRVGGDDHALARRAMAISATRAAGQSPASRTVTPPTSISISAGTLTD